jgi:D-alanine-D-alanine ligase
MKMRIAILTGGTSSERAIALASAEGVKNALAGRFDIVIYDLPDNLDEFLSQYRSVSAVIPVFHGRGGEDGAVQGFLRTLNVPFLFSNVEAQALAANKYLAKNLIEKHGIATPKAVVVSNSDKINFKSPVVVKPLDGGSSIGVSIVKDKNDLAKALKEAFAQSPKVLIEDYIEGNEYTVAVIEGENGYTALPVVAIVPKTEFFDNKSKYDPSLVEEICPAPISAKLSNVLKDAAIKAHDVIGALHISRSDFIVDKNGKVWFLEINTIPGLTANSLVPKALKAAGIDFGELVDSWVRVL